MAFKLLSCQNVKGKSEGMSTVGFSHWPFVSVFKEWDAAALPLLSAGYQVAAWLFQRRPKQSESRLLFHPPCLYSK